MLNSIAPAFSAACGSVADRIYRSVLPSVCSPGVRTSRLFSVYLPQRTSKEAQKGALYCAFLKIIGFMYLALPGVIAYALFELAGRSGIHDGRSVPAVGFAKVVPAPLMGFFAAVMLGAILPRSTRC